MNNQQMLEMAAKASGNTVYSAAGLGVRSVMHWNPLDDDADAFGLAVKLKMQVIVHCDWVEVLVDGIQVSSPESCYSADGCMLETARRAIVLAAARIGADS